MSTEKLKVNAWPMFKLGLKTFLTLYNCFDFQCMFIGCKYYINAGFARA